MDAAVEASPHPWVIDVHPTGRKIYRLPCDNFAEKDEQVQEIGGGRAPAGRGPLARA